MKLIIILAAIACVTVALSYLLADHVPRWLMTANRLSGVQLRFEDFVATHHKLPVQLADLPQRPDHDDRPIDAWGEPLVYERQRDGSVVLRSLGGGEKNARTVQFSTGLEPDSADRAAEQTTFSNMWTIECYLRRYAREHGVLPDSLSQLSPELERVFSDGWGARVDYKPGSDGSVVLKSRGRPGSDQIFSTRFFVPAGAQN